MNVEIVFNFDTTGSMSQALSSVRRNIEQTVTNLFKEIPNLRIGIGANGDYCDAGTTYVTKTLDLTDKIHPIVDFARNTKSTNGGDSDECYELVLHEARNYSWTVNARKVLVMIGDALPHSPSYPQNTKRLDWRAEAKALKDIGVEIYSVQCLSRTHFSHFWKEMAELTGGYHLELGQFTDLEAMLMAITYKQSSDEAVQKFEQKLTNSGRMNRTLDTAIGVLTGRPRDAKTGRFVAYKHVTDKGETLHPVSAGRFQVMDVDKDSVIRDFAEEHGLKFQPGKGYYSWGKAETIQDRKEIIIQDKVSGDMFTGAHARELLDIPLGMGKRKLSPGGRTAKWNVFIQSTSYNRKLIGGTKFLYEVDEV